MDLKGLSILKNNESSSVLQKCGIPDEIIHSLKKIGLIVPEKIVSVKEPLRSPSEEWFYQIADRFTPPLDKAEIVVFRKHPYLLTLDILKGVDILFTVSSTLYDALEKVKTNLKDEESVAAILSVLRVFHGCLDNNYLKYDRHLEYHEYEISPVGYYWNLYEKMCIKAAKRGKMVNPEEWAKLKMLDIISGPRRHILSSEYAICCNEIFVQMDNNINIKLDNITEILNYMKKENKELHSIIIKYSELFYRSPEIFLRDCIALGPKNPFNQIMKRKQQAIDTISEIKSYLTETDAMEFERIVEAIEGFLAIQELEGTIAYGEVKGIKNHIFDVLIVGFAQLNDILINNQNYIKSEKRQEILELLKAEEIPMQFMAVRKIITEMEYSFNDRIEKRYIDELSRWM